MPIFELTPNMMREIIMDHASSPRHYEVPTGEGYFKEHASSTNCIDDFDLYLKKENGVIKDACFYGTACTISKSSTDILCDLIIGQDEQKASQIIGEYLKMIHEEPYDASLLDEALAFMNTSKQAGRIHCATMGWDTILEMLKEEDK